MIVELGTKNALGRLFLQLKNIAADAFCTFRYLEIIGLRVVEYRIPDLSKRGLTYGVGEHQRIRAAEDRDEGTFSNFLGYVVKLVAKVVAFF